MTKNTSFLDPIQNFLLKSQQPMIRQTPYSLDMIPCDIWLFFKLIEICFHRKLKSYEYCVHSGTQALMLCKYGTNITRAQRRYHSTSPTKCSFSCLIFFTGKIQVGYFWKNVVYVKTLTTYLSFKIIWF